jgi:two-component system, response regulator / RNA-binding antiterminator
MMLATAAPWFDQELGPMLRIMVIDESPECARTLRDGLERAGHQIVASLSSTRDLLDQMDKLAPDVLMITTNSPSRDMLEHICVVSQDRPRPIVMFTGDTDPNTIQAAVRAGVTAYIVDGLEPQRIKPIVDVAVARFKEHHALKTELSRTKTEIAERKIVERAKGILMKKRQWDEETAYQALRRMSMDRNLRLSEVAKQVVRVAELLG